MTTNFLPSEVLSAAVDPYYFLWAPLRSARHNYAAAFCFDMRVQNVAQNAIKGNFFHSCKVYGAHFATHMAAALSFTVPLVNILPFSIFVVKAKEGLVPNNPHQMQVLVQVAMVERGDVPGSKNNLKPIPMKKPTLPKQIDPPKSTPVILQKPSPEAISSPDDVKKRDSAPVRRSSSRVNEKINHWQKLSHPEPVKTEFVVIDTAGITKVKALEKEFAVGYFVLFPEESPEHVIRKLEKSKFSPPTEKELEIVNNLILRSDAHLHLQTVVKGDINEAKFNQAINNLKILNEFLLKTFGEKAKDYYFQRTAGRHLDLQVASFDLQSEKTTPFEIVKKAIFFYSSDEFSKLLTAYDFENVEKVIRINNK